MKRVVCVFIAPTPGSAYLTVGKIYDVYNIESYLDSDIVLEYRVKTDNGDKYWFDSHFFAELDKWRKLRIEEILS